MKDDPRSDTPSMRARRSRRTRATAACAVGLLVAAGCSTGRNTDAADASPTFRRISDDALRYEEPISQVADLLPPREEGDPWRIVGAILDPDSGRTEAAVWSAAAPPSWELQEIEAQDSDVSEAMEAAAPFGDTLLAVGRVGDGAEADAALWRADGDSWQLSTPTEMGGRHEQWAFDLAVGEGGVLVAGGESVWGDVHPKLWFSADGESWSSVDGGPGGPLDTTGEESVQAISSFGAGFVAVGMRDLEGNQDGLVWFSPDGTTWEQVDVPTMGGPGRQNILSLATVNGTLVAGGYVVGGDNRGVPMVWTSTDGRNWSPPALLPTNSGRLAASDVGVHSLSVNGTQLVAAGGDGGWRPHLWTSDDAGVTWNPLPDPVGAGDLFKDGVDLIDAVGTANSAYVALGDEPTIMDLQRNRWTDAAGDAFPTGGNRPQGTTVLLDDENRLLAAGFNYTSAHGDEREHITGRVWVRDGGGIDVVAPDEEHLELEAGQINDLATYKGGYVAVGFEDFAYADLRTVAASNGDAQPDGLLWTSEDGTTWTRQAAQLQVPDVNPLTVIDADAGSVASQAVAIAAEQPVVTNDPAGGFGTRSLEAVASLFDGYIAVGSAYTDADGDPSTTGYDTNALVTVSYDGVAIAPEDPGLAGPGIQRLRDVCVAEDGTAVAVGVSENDGSFDVAVSRRRTDAIWAPGTAEDGSFAGAGNQEALGCAAGGDGFIMVGTDDSGGNTDARLWTSTNGVDWRELPSGALGGTGNQQATTAAAVEDGGWLVGGSDTLSGDSDVALWRVSAESQVTRRDRDEPVLGGPGNQDVTALYVSGDRAVLVGQDQTGVGIWETTNLDR